MRYLYILLLLLAALPAAAGNAPANPAGHYWVNSNGGTVHNATCQNYGKTKRGYYTDNPSGKDCGICGGTKGK